MKQVLTNEGIGLMADAFGTPSSSAGKSLVAGADGVMVADFVTQFGKSGAAATYTGGTKVVPTVVAGATCKPGAGDSTMILTVDCVVTLDHNLPDNTRIEFVATTASPNHSLVPDGGLLINGAASLPFARGYGGQVVIKYNGAWIAVL